MIAIDPGVLAFLLAGFIFGVCGGFFMLALGLGELAKRLMR